jgi:hypothetical protein
MRLPPALYRREDSSIKELMPFTPGELSGFSEEAIRAGYIGLAKWLVKSEAVREAVERFLVFVL